MIVNSIKLTLRNLYKDYIYSVINIVGLSIGIASCIVLGLYLQSELTYDYHFNEHNRIYRVASEINSNGSINHYAQTAYALAPFLKRESENVAAYVRFFSPSSGYSLFKHDQIAHRWDNVYLVDPNVFEVFNHRILFGNPENALRDPKSIAISESFSKKYFGDKNPVGKFLAGGLSDYKITLVFADLPDNTHLKYDALVSYQDLPSAFVDPTLTERVKHDLWYAKTDYTYLLMKADYDPESFSMVSDKIYQTYMSSYPDSFNSTARFYLEPLTRIHLHSKTQRDQPRGSRFYLLGFSAIAIFVMAIACINYMNMSTARYSRRLKEVTIRKFLGASRSQLIIQFLIEAVLFTFFALLISIVIANFILKYSSLNALFGKSLSLVSLLQPESIVLLISATFIVSMVAGLYPALHMSSYSPFSELKSKNSAVRQGLVFIQFLVSVCVIACVLLMYLQMNYVQSRPLGFDNQNKLVMEVSGAQYIEAIPVLKTELMKSPGIKGVSASMGQVGGLMGVSQAEVENDEGQFATQSYNWFYIDEHYIDTLGIDIVQGRNFNKSIQEDFDSGILVNETLVNKMGWKNPIGKGLRYEKDATARVIGVMKDFNFKGLQHQVEPMVFWLSPKPDYTGWSKRARKLQRRILTIDIDKENQPGTIDFIGKKWAQFDPEHPFEYHFLQDKLDDAYTSDFKQMQLIGFFALLCVFLSCLGLYGLTAFTIEQRTKEIGIRKVLGSSSWEIIFLLFKNILTVIVFAIVLASGLSYLIMDKWLEGFFYHTEINPLVFLISGLVSIFIAFVTVTIQSYKTAKADPAHALRYE